MPHGGEGAVDVVADRHGGCDRRWRGSPTISHRPVEVDDAQRQCSRADLSRGRCAAHEIQAARASGQCRGQSDDLLAVGHIDQPVGVVLQRSVQVALEIHRPGALHVQGGAAQAHIVSEGDHLAVGARIHVGQAIRGIGCRGGDGRAQGPGHDAAALESQHTFAGIDERRLGRVEIHAIGQTQFAPFPVEVDSAGQAFFDAYQAVVAEAQQVDLRRLLQGDGNARQAWRATDMHLAGLHRALERGRLVLHAYIDDGSIDRAVEDDGGGPCSVDPADGLAVLTDSPGDRGGTEQAQRASVRCMGGQCRDGRVCTGEVHAGVQRQRAAVLQQGLARP